MPAASYTTNPYATLTVIFVGWKVLLLAIAVGSQVAPTYDTSSSLLLTPDQQLHLHPIRTFLTRLTSWDAIYFVKAAQRGYLFEQEWAFGSALPRCVSLLLRALVTLGLVSPPSENAPYLEALIAVVFTNLCHFLSTLVLYHLSLRVWGDAFWALCAALLHVFSPAGLFLSAPYTESPFSLLTFIGWLLLVKSCTASNLSRDVLTLLAGGLFGLATVFRTNGLLNGTPFAFEFLSTLYCLVEDMDYDKTPAYIRRLVVLGLSGIFVAAGSFVPQFVAYRMYCSSALEVRPWCVGLMPSIFNYVQQQYWNTGFLHYWTLPNAPLFLLAGPMLFIMSKSGKDIFFQALQLSSEGSKHSGGPRLVLVVRSMVAAQVFLVIMAFFNYHVQIITRLSSAYPVWYWWVAACLRSPKTRRVGSGIVVFMTMYASIQAVLFASFLPPA